MALYIIERNMPGADQLSPYELQAVARNSLDILDELGRQIQWKQSFVTGDRFYCVYSAPNEAVLDQHAQQAGFPATRIMEIGAVIDPTTAQTDERT